MSSKTDRRLRSRRIAKRGKAKKPVSQAQLYKQRRDTIERRDFVVEEDDETPEEATVSPEPAETVKEAPSKNKRKKKASKKAGSEESNTKKLKKTKKKSAKIRKRRRTTPVPSENDEDPAPAEESPLPVIRQEKSEAATLRPGEIAAAAAEVTRSGATLTRTQDRGSLRPGEIVAAAQEATQERRSKAALLSPDYATNPLSGLLFPKTEENDESDLFEDAKPKLLFEGIDFATTPEPREEPLSTSSLKTDDDEEDEEDEDEPLLARAESLYDAPSVSYTFSYEPPTSTPEPGVAGAITNVAEATVIHREPEPLEESEPTTKFDPNATRSALVAEAAAELNPTLKSNPKFNPTSRPRSQSKGIKLRGNSSRFQVHTDLIENNWQDWPVTRALMRAPRDAYAGAAAFCVACVLAMTLAMGEKPPQALTQEPVGTPTPVATPVVAVKPDPESPPPAKTPAQWRPATRPSYTDDSIYGYLPGYRQTRHLTNPTMATIGSVANGRKVYERNCIPCHGAAGQPKANLRVPPRNLSNPYEYEYGADDAAIYRTVAYGLPNSAMGGYRQLLTDQEVWDVVNFVKSLQRKVR